MNVKLIRRVQKFLELHPERYDQNAWGACRTMACLGGIVNILTKTRGLPAAAKELGLACRGSRLFAVPGVPGRDVWPRRFRMRYLNAKTAKGRARVAIDRLEHFIKTAGAE